jgi:hypothetical protein
MLLARLAISATLLIAPVLAHAQMRCEDVFVSQIQIERVIENLASLRLNLDLAQAQGGMTPHVTALRSQYLKKEKGLLHYVETHSMMSAEELARKIRLAIKDLQPALSDHGEKTAIDREVERQVFIAKKFDGSTIVFHKIKPGSFTMRGKSSVTTIDKPFEMAATLTTQKIWKAIVEAQGSRLGYHLLKSDPSRIKGDLNPVERISLTDVEYWISLLNSLAEADDPVVDELMPGHKRGDKYRLPTQAEWEFVERGRGTIKTKYFFGDDPAKMPQYAWYDKNWNDAGHPVAKLKPLVVDGQNFYDLYGSVPEWTSDQLPSRNYVIMGSTVQTPEESLIALDQASASYYGYIGFRLVRASR